MTATAQDPYLGRTLGHVRLNARLGAGAMGVVYRGWHERLEREVAVKMLVSQRGDKPTYRERFLREGRAAAKVRHEHVVAVLDAGQEGDVAYLVMEFVNGMSLGSILDEAGRLAPDVVGQLGVGMALGLAAMHDKGIVHRDIKPDNVLVGADRKARIADLGLAKQLNDPELQRLTATGVVVGTPLYVSPEGIRDPETISPKSDIYSLGATFYHMLAGRPPFQGDTPYEVMHGHLQGKLTPLRTLNPALPGELASLVERCLSRDPDRRPTAMEVADALIGGGPKTTGGNPALIAAIVAVLALGGGAAWFLLTGASVTETTSSLPPPAPGQASDLRLATDLGEGARLVVDGTPVPLGTGPITLAAGTRQILVEVDRGGPLRRAATSLDLAAGGSQTWSPDLVTVPVPDQRLTVPGKGLLVVEGQAYGLDPVYPTGFAGTYHLARWDGHLWTSGAVAVRDDGTVPETTWSTGEKPDAAAFWRRGGEGQALPPHHLVSWWMADQVRQAATLPAAVGWTSQGSRPEQAASNVPPDLVSVLADRAAAWGAGLPTRAQALDLAGRLGTSLWCRDQGALARVGGLGGAPMVALVPLP